MEYFTKWHYADVQFRRELGKEIGDVWLKVLPITLKCKLNSEELKTIIARCYYANRD